MITQDEAQRIAEALLRSKGIDVERIASIKLRNARDDCAFWICNFLNVVPPDVVDSPDVTIVEVNSVTGEASLFDAL